MLMRRRTFGLLKALGLFAAGIVCGIQLALYLYDYFDNGVADPGSLWIGIGMVAPVLVLLLFDFRQRSED